MRAICVDDERLLMEYTVSLCAEVSGIQSVKGFTKPREALAWAAENPVDLALLDIDMPAMSGISLAYALKTINPDMLILFLTGFSQFASVAAGKTAPGYLLKPVTKTQLEYELTRMRSFIPEVPQEHVCIRTFGQFEVLAGGQPFVIEDPLCKELLAHLVDRHGADSARPALAAALFPGIPNGSEQLKQLEKLILSLRDLLRARGIDRIAVLSRFALHICPEKVFCDAYRFSDGDCAAINACRGSYLGDYPWADYQKCLTEWKAQQ